MKVELAGGQQFDRRRWAEKQAGPESIFNTPNFDFFLQYGSLHDTRSGCSARDRREHVHFRSLIKVLTSTMIDSGKVMDKGCLAQVIQGSPQVLSAVMLTM